MVHQVWNTTQNAVHKIKFLTGSSRTHKLFARFFHKIKSSSKTKRLLVKLDRRLAANPPLWIHFDDKYFKCLLFSKQHHKHTKRKLYSEIKIEIIAVPCGNHFNLPESVFDSYLPRKEDSKRCLLAQKPSDYGSAVAIDTAALLSFSFHLVGN